VLRLVNSFAAADTQLPQLSRQIDELMLLADEAERFEISTSHLRRTALQPQTGVVG
jgi:hypothetical protein